MSDKLTYMDCWHFIAPLIPVDTDYTMDIYIMVFNALKEAEKKRIAEKKKGRKSTHEKARYSGAERALRDTAENDDAEDSRTAQGQAERR